MKLYTSEDEALTVVRVALQKIVNFYKSDIDTTGIRSHEKDVYSIEVDGLPKYWFFGDLDLMTWLEGVADGTNPTLEQDTGGLNGNSPNAN